MKWMWVNFDLHLVFDDRHLFPHLTSRLQIALIMFSLCNKGSFGWCSMLERGKWSYLTFCLNKKKNDSIFLSAIEWLLLIGFKPADGFRGLPLIAPEVMSYSTERKLKLDQVTRLRATVTQTGMLVPDTSAYCQTVLFWQSRQSQMAPSNKQTSSSYQPIFCISY